MEQTKALMFDMSSVKHSHVSVIKSTFEEDLGDECD